jgi:molybdate transport system substrate-binding protein
LLTNDSQGGADVPYQFRLRFAVRSVFALIALLFIAGCGSDTREERQPLLVFAAASLADSLPKIEAAFEADHPRIDVTIHYAGSGALRQQIEQGAPADIFFSASLEHMDALLREGLVREADVERFLGNELVVVVPSDSSKPLPSLEALQTESYARIAIGTPETVPAGLYAKQALERGGLFDRIADKLVYGKDVRSVLTFVETGNADAGFVYKTDALSTERVRIAFTPDQASFGKIVYPVGVMDTSVHKEEARQWIAYLADPVAMRIFTDMGFADLR